MKKKSKVNNFLTGTGNDSVYNPEKIEKSVAVQLSEEVDNQYRVFREEMENVNEKMDKRYREILSHIAMLYQRLAKADEKIELLEKENQVRGKNGIKRVRKQNK